MAAVIIHPPCLVSRLFSSILLNCIFYVKPMLSLLLCCSYHFLFLSILRAQVFCISICIPHIHTWCPQKLEESGARPGTEATDAFRLPCGFYVFWKSSSCSYPLSQCWSLLLIISMKITAKEQIIFFFFLHKSTLVCDLRAREGWGRWIQALPNGQQMRV